MLKISTMIRRVMRIFNQYYHEYMLETRRKVEALADNLGLEFKIREVKTLKKYITTEDKLVAVKKKGK